MSKDPTITLDVLYLDCSADVLLRRFSETRRRHPQAPMDRPAMGIEREMEMLWPIRERADVLINTSDMTAQQLRHDVVRHFRADATNSQLAISVQSFSYKRGIPRGLDMMFDCRFLNNPYWDESLRPLNGQDAKVQDFVQQDPRFAGFVQNISDLLHLVIPAHIDEGRTHLSIGFGCTGGQHRSVTMAEHFHTTLQGRKARVTLRHRELDRQAVLSPPTQVKIA